jgi:phage gpG-like protein
MLQETLLLLVVQGVQMALVVLVEQVVHQQVTLVVQYVLRSKVVIPARPFVGFAPETRAVMTDLVAQERAKQVAASWA